MGGKLKLIDFGIAKALQQDKTGVILETQIGTLNYMSPEAIKDLESCGDLKPKFKVIRRDFLLIVHGTSDYCDVAWEERGT